MPEIGAHEIAGLAVLVVMLREVFAFVVKMMDRKDAAARPDPEIRIVALMERQTDLMERLTPMVEEIHRTTENYERAGVCPLTKPEGRDSVARAIGQQIKSKD